MIPYFLLDVNIFLLKYFIGALMIALCKRFGVGFAFGAWVKVKKNNAFWKKIFHIYGLMKNVNFTWQYAKEYGVKCKV